MLIKNKTHRHTSLGKTFKKDKEKYLYSLQLFLMFAIWKEVKIWNCMVMTLALENNILRWVLDCVLESNFHIINNMFLEDYYGKSIVDKLK